MAMSQIRIVTKIWSYEILKYFLENVYVLNFTDTLTISETASFTYSVKHFSPIKGGHQLLEYLCHLLKYKSFRQFIAYDPCST